MEERGGRTWKSKVIWVKKKNQEIFLMSRHHGQQFSGSEAERAMDVSGQLWRVELERGRARETCGGVREWT